MESKQREKKGWESGEKRKTLDHAKTLSDLYGTSGNVIPPTFS